MNMLRILVSFLAVLLLGWSVPGLTSPCRDDNWQPTYVHDLVSNDPVPYYVMPDGSFVALTGDWSTQSGPGMCCLYGVRDRRGFTDCQHYTRVQCGCDRQSVRNRTCRRFLEFKGVSIRGDESGGAGVRGVTVDPSGTWKTAYGTMTFRRDGAGYRAEYDSDQGRIIGTMRGNVLEGVWVEASSSHKCKTPRDGSYYWGRVVFEFSPDRFEGRWGYCDSAPTLDWSGARQ